MLLRQPPDCRFNSLPLWLFFSSLLHMLVIALPHFEKASNRERTALASAPGRQLPLSATLKKTARIVALRESRPRAVKKSLPLAEPAPEVVIAAPTDLLPLPEADFYETSELSAKPQLQEEPALESSELADIIASGKVVLTLRINAQGVVANASIDASDLPEAFSQSAIKAFQNLRFVPGELNGQPVGSILRIEVRYDDGRLPAPLLVP